MRCVLTFLTLGISLVFFVLGCGSGGTTPPPGPGPDTRTAFFTTNWGDDSIRRTLAIDQMADGTTATPEMVVGAATLIDQPITDSLYVDATNERLYVTGWSTVPPGDAAVFVFDNALTCQGNIAPDRVIEFSPAANDATGIELDEARDRLYVYADIPPNYFLQIFNNASTLNGIVPADVTILVPGIQNDCDLFLDTLNDRLYVMRDSATSVSIYENAGSLAGDVTATPRVIHGVVDHGYGKGVLYYDQP